MEEKKNCKEIWDAGNPCLDLFYNIIQPRIRDGCIIHRLTKAGVEARVTSLKQLLPLAWSKNPLTTLKLICKLLSLSCRSDYYPYHLDVETFKTAAGWLHQNHSNTLACNISSIAKWFDGRMSSLLLFLYQLLPHSEGDKHYMLLHDRVMDVLAEMLKSDIHKMKHNKLELKPFDFTGLDDDDVDYDSEDEEEKLYTLHSDALHQLKVTETAKYCITVDGHSEEAHWTHAFHAIQLRESIATRLFPELKSKPDWERLQKEVLGPLTKYSRRQYMFNRRERPWMFEYLEKVKAAAVAGGGNDIMKLDWDALPPKWIIGILGDADVWMAAERITKIMGDADLGKAAELQWNALVNHLKQEGKFKNSLALFETPTRMQPTWSTHGGLGFLVSQLCDVEPWKGNVIRKDDMEKPELLLIQGNDLKSKLKFLRTTLMGCKWNVDVLKVLELILEVNLNENLKLEQMIKKLFVFHDMQTSIEEHKYEEYEAIRNKFKAKGYEEDAIPHIIFCQSKIKYNCIQQYRGFTLLDGLSFGDNFINLFLDNGGEIGPQHFMEACIADKEYQHLYVVD